MLTRKNQKLGNTIYMFNLPARLTCPVISRVCSVICYASRGRFHHSNVKRALAKNYAAVRRGDFVARINAQLLTESARIVRIHGAGDFFNLTYIHLWRKIARANRHIIFYAYTRAWKKQQLLPALIALGQERNVRLWWSTDRSMPEPPRTPGIRIGWLATSDDDVPPYPVDMVFRDRPRTRMKFMEGYQVCPYEQMVPERKFRITCDRCGICYKPEREKHAGSGTGASQEGHRRTARHLRAKSRRHGRRNASDYSEGSRFSRRKRSRNALAKTSRRRRNAVGHQ